MEGTGLSGFAIVIGVVILIVIVAFLYEVGRRLYFWIAPKIYKWTPEETHKREMASLGIYSDVSGAQKSYRRKRSRRGLFYGAFALVLAFVPWHYGWGLTDKLIWYVGLFVAYLYYQTEIRLKTMQIRLAQMHDALERIGGTADPDQKDDNYISELSDY